MPDTRTTLLLRLGPDLDEVRADYIRGALDRIGDDVATALLDELPPSPTIEDALAVVAALHDELAARGLA